MTRHARPEESPYARRARLATDPEAGYWALVEGATLGDVVHHRLLEVTGPDAVAFVQRLVTRDLSGHEIGQCKYAFMTNVDGGIVADPVVVRLADECFWLSVAAADPLPWCREVADAGSYRVALTAPDVAPVLVQGPRAAAVMEDIFGDELADLAYHRVLRRSHDGLDLVISRTGWGGIDGFEVWLSDARADGSARAEQWWDTVMRAGERHGIVAAPPSLAHRIESGMVALGRDIDESTNPFEVGSGFEWMVDLDQPDEFVGKAALRVIRAAGPTRRLVGLDLDEPGMVDVVDRRPSGGIPVQRDGDVVGALTSVSRSQRLRCDIGFALVGSEHATLGTRVTLLPVGVDPIGATVVEKARLP